VAPRSLFTLPALHPVGVPQVHHFGQEGLHNVLAIDLLGPNLEDLFDMCGRKFSVKTVCLAAKQMVCVMFSDCQPSRVWHLVLSFPLVHQVTRIQSVHDKSLIYRDIKPDNFLIGVPGTKNANVIHLIGMFVPHLSFPFLWCSRTGGDGSVVVTVCMTHRSVTPSWRSRPFHIKCVG
jgi:serine/threonine protein kinase